MEKNGFGFEANPYIGGVRQVCSGRIVEVAKEKVMCVSLETGIMGRNQSLCTSLHIKYGTEFKSGLSRIMSASGSD